MDRVHRSWVVPRPNRGLLPCFSPMSRAIVTVVANGPPDEILKTEIVVVGGGICGILAAKHCSDRRWPYIVVDRNEELGGVWGTLANRHSYLQAGR